MRTIAAILMLCWALFAGVDTVEAQTDSARQESTCVTPVASAGTRTWKYGASEERDFAQITSLVTSNPAAPLELPLELLDSFLSRYPISDYRAPVLFYKVTSAYNLKKWNEGLQAAEQLLNSPDLIVSIVLLGYAVEADLLPISMAKAQVQGGDPFNQSRIDELAKAVRCGREVLAVIAASPPALLPFWGPQLRTQSEVAFARAQGEIALKHKDYATAKRELQQARRLNPEDTRSYILQASAELSDVVQNTDAGVFYLARAAALSPDVAGIQNALRELYTLLHGSAEGLGVVRTLAAINYNPPTGFHVTPPQTGKVASTNRRTALLTIMRIVAAGYLAYQQCMEDQLCGAQESRIPEGRRGKR